jgi:hypothetical protein
MTDEDRERLYQQYCKKNKLDPSLEYSVYEFFDTIDKRGEDETATDSTELDIDSL